MHRRAYLASGLAGVGGLLAGCSGGGAPDADFYVAPDGDDGWSGRAPSPGGADGPFATLDRARRAVRSLDLADRRDPVRVLLRGGVYWLDAPVEFGPGDGGTESAPVVYAAFPGETPVVSGGRAIDGWTETTVAGRRAWRATLPEGAGDGHPIRQLWVDGERRYRPRLPQSVDRAFAPRADAAAADPDLLATERGPPDPRRIVVRDRPAAVDADAELVRMKAWGAERLPIRRLGDDGLVTVARRTAGHPGEWGVHHAQTAGGGQCYFANVTGALARPGQWTVEGDRLTYLPREGETPAAVTAVVPVTDRLVDVAGGEIHGPVEHLRFRGLTFAHAGWDYPPRGHLQAAATVPGAVSLERARHVAVRDCDLAHVGQYGLAVGRDCRDVTVSRSRFADLGAGGVTVNLGPGRTDPGGVRIADSTVRDGGLVFHSAAGVLVQHARDVELVHNEVSDLYYGGISTGWTWGYRDSESANVDVRGNYVHDVGGLAVEERFGIYGVGTQENVTVSGNVVADVFKTDPLHGGGIDLDPGSTGWVVEDNLVHGAVLTVNFTYGRDNVFRNNVLVGGQAMTVDGGPVAPDGTGSGTSMRFEHNVLVADDCPVYDAPPDAIESDRNLLWDRADGAVEMLRGPLEHPIDQWRRNTGNDRHSVVADPGIERLTGARLDLAADSPARDVGFEPFDPSEAGPRSE
ncbi:MAG: right-handed parallel beta-helix repeat-containing protein [Haloarculaceae archaeon]